MNIPTPPKSSSVENLYSFYGELVGVLSCLDDKSAQDSNDIQKLYNLIDDVRKEIKAHEDQREKHTSTELSAGLGSVRTRTDQSIKELVIALSSLEEKMGEALDDGLKAVRKSGERELREVNSQLKTNTGEIQKKAYLTDLKPLNDNIKRHEDTQIKQNAAWSTTKNIMVVFWILFGSLIVGVGNSMLTNYDNQTEKLASQIKRVGIAEESIRSLRRDIGDSKDEIKKVVNAIAKMEREHNENRSNLMKRKAQYEISKGSSNVDLGEIDANKNRLKGEKEL